MTTNQRDRSAQEQAKQTQERFAVYDLLREDDGWSEAAEAKVLLLLSNLHEQFAATDPDFAAASPDEQQRFLKWTMWRDMEPRIVKWALWRESEQLELDETECDGPGEAPVADSDAEALAELLTAPGKDGLPMVGIFVTSDFRFTVLPRRAWSPEHYEHNMCFVSPEVAAVMAAECLEKHGVVIPSPYE